VVQAVTVAVVQVSLLVLQLLELQILVQGVVVAVRLLQMQQAVTAVQELLLLDT
jgi:hypothetical protein